MHYVKRTVDSDVVGFYAFFPAGDREKKYLGKLVDGEVVDVDVHQQRNYQQLKYFWAVCRAVADNYRHPKFADLDTARKIAEYIKLKLGYVDYRIVVGDRVHLKTKSISYGRMSQEEWKKFFDEAIKIIDSLGGYRVDQGNMEIYQGDVEDDR